MMTTNPLPRLVEAMRPLDRDALMQLAARIDDADENGLVLSPDAAAAALVEEMIALDLAHRLPQPGGLAKGLPKMLAARITPEGRRLFLDLLARAGIPH